MKRLSSQEKKELFMSMVERDKKGTLDMMRMTESKTYDEIYSNLGNNYGPFGIVLNGVMKNGQISVFLAEQLHKQLPTNMLGISSFSGINFEESELNKFLDRFYDMNNMEILNEFLGEERKYLKDISIQEHKDDKNSNFFNRLLMLNGLDYLTQLGDFQVTTVGVDNYRTENGLNIKLKVGRNEDDCMLWGEDYGRVIIDVRTGEIKEQDLHNPQLKEYLDIFLQSVRDLPQVYDSIVKGTYRREDFIPTMDSQKKPKPLQQRENELSSLEAEAKTISEAEALIDQQQGQQQE